MIQVPEKKNILVSGRPEQKCPVNAILLLK
jgi:hypothetical protein